MSGQSDGQIFTLKPPNTADQDDWMIYWIEQGQPWRTKPEIDAERQQYLQERRYRWLKEREYDFPFRNIPLSRADIEWLLATHKGGHAIIDWNNQGQRERLGLDLNGADLQGVDLSYLPLANSAFFKAHLEEASAYRAHLEGSIFTRAYLEGANLSHAHLESASFDDAHLEGADLLGAHLEGAKLMEAHLEGASLSRCYFDAETDLNSVTLFSQERGAVVLGDVHWGDVNVGLVDWSALPLLGNESMALKLKDNDGTSTDKAQFTEFLKRAARAYRQLSVVLRNQGLNEDAARFAYRAQLMQRRVLRQEKKFGQYLFSLFLDLLAGYGYKPWRSFAAYLIVIAAFATAYFIIGQTVGPALSPLGSVVFSMTSFHGRGFFPGGIKLDDPLTVLAVLEAFVGLLIEVTFIATLTQRLFGK